MTEFAYTVGATLACAMAGTEVCHVDASKRMVALAKENALKSGLENAPIHWIVDDCLKFVEREIRRGRKYDVLIMDPPVYVHAPFFLPRSGMFSSYQQPMTDKIYLSQFQIIQSLAAKEPCVIVGRSAGYVLKETALKVFIRADLSARVQRKLALGIDIPEDKMPQHIQAIDKKRSQYYQHYTDQILGDVRNYNLCIDTTEIGTDGGSELILCYLKQLGEIS